MPQPTCTAPSAAPEPPARAANRDRRARPAIAPCAAALGFALLSGCIPTNPAGAPFVLLTVELPAGAALAPGATALESTDDPVLAIARAVAGADVQRLGAAPHHLRLPGTASTFSEHLTAQEYETAAFLTEREFDEPSGLLQGFFHLHDLDAAVAAGAEDPLVPAVEGARRFVAEKLPRPMEDPPFVWLHLDLTASAEPQARLLEAREALLEALRPAPRWLLADLRVVTGGSTGLTLLGASGPVELPREAPLAYERITELFDAPLGLASAAGAAPDAGQRP